MTTFNVLTNEVEEIKTINFGIGTLRKSSSGFVINCEKTPGGSIVINNSLDAEMLSRAISKAVQLGWVNDTVTPRDGSTN